MMLGSLPGQKTENATKTQKKAKILKKRFQYYKKWYKIISLDMLLHY